MRKTVSLILALLLLLLGCSSRSNIIKEYEGQGNVVTCTAKLYPENAEDGKYALLLRKYDDVRTRIAVTDGLENEAETVYTLPEGTFAFELTAGGGLIAFYQLISYTDGSVNYALKVIDTNDNNKVHSPYSKTVSSVAENQTRFLSVFGGCVYYLTASVLLGRCRVMKYDTETEELTEYLSYAFIENELTEGHSCTFISGRDGYLSCGTVEGSVCSVKTYNLRTGNLTDEKKMPDNVGMIFYADFDRMTGIYALYYLDAKTDGEKVGIVTASADAVTDLYTALDSEYICRDRVTVYNNLICFNVEDAEKESGAYNGFYGVMMNIVDGSSTAFKGSLQLFIKDNDVYNLSFDKKAGYDKVVLSKVEIR